MRTGDEAAPGAIAYVVRSYPRLSQTFVLNEILALERLGSRIQIYAMTRAAEAVVQDQVAGIRAPVTYLDEGGVAGRRGAPSAHLRVAAAHPRAYLRSLLYVLQHPELDTGYRTRSRFGCFDLAVRMAAEVGRRSTGEEVGHIHSHFAHDPTLVAQLAGRLTGTPFSFTAHARDLVQIPRSALAARIEEAQAVVTCCRANVDYIHRSVHALSAGKLALVYHGVDTRRFSPSGVPSGVDPPLVISVGRLVEKKGFALLVRALREVRDRERRFRCEIYGEGPLGAELAALIRSFDLEGIVKVAGARPQTGVAEALRRADLFALTPVVTPGGDRDGLPNAVLEAMACGLPVVATAVGGIPEAVAHGRTGLLCPPGDLLSIAGHIAGLLDDASLRARMGAEGRRTVVERFDARASTRRLAALFGRRAEGIEEGPERVLAGSG
jgi:glycosyltransferase involved in cell wall biosynthesis